MTVLDAPIVTFMLLTKMNKKQFLRFLLLFFVGSLGLTGCEPEKVSVDIDEGKLIGVWYALDNTQEYWRFNVDYKGVTWDESEDVQESEGIKYNWAVVGDQLQLDFYGEMGQHVYYDYTFTAQNDTSFTWKDIYGNSRTFVKK